MPVNDFGITAGKKRKFNEENHYQNGNGAKHFKNGFNEKSPLDEVSLPICVARDKIVSEIKKHSTAIIISETGSGKTTQIPQFIYEEHLNKNGMIGITQVSTPPPLSLKDKVALSRHV